MEEEMPEADPKVVAKTDEEVNFRCGHTGPAKFAHQVFGKEHQIKAEILGAREKCGECMLAEVKPHFEEATCCAVCGRIIFKGRDCVIHEGEILCLSMSCGPGPLGANPGIWNGETFVDGFTAGTMRVVSLGSSKD